MAKARPILVDTDILIKLFRGDSKKKKILDDNKGNLSVSVITYFELLSGLKTRQRIIDLNKQMKAYKHHSSLRKNIYKIHGPLPKIFNCK